MKFGRFVEISEHYLNLFKDDEATRREWVDQAWDMMQVSYAPVGGCQGSGFSSKEDMIKNIPMWKLIVRNGKLVAAAFYKDKSGRKRVALCAERSQEGKDAIKDLLFGSIKKPREWGEVSGPSWGFILKTVPPQVLQSIVLPIEEVKRLLPNDDIVPALGRDPDVKYTDPYKNFYYIRDIGGGHLHTKIALGRPDVPLY